MKNNIIVSFILLIIISIFLFCGKAIESFVSNCSVEDKKKCTDRGKICMNDECKTQVCTPLKKISCAAFGAVCKESVGCSLKKKEISMYTAGRGYMGRRVETRGENIYNKRVDVSKLIGKYD